jgi:hypothetical protein
VRAHLQVDGQWAKLANGSQVLPGEYALSVGSSCQELHAAGFNADRIQDQASFTSFSYVTFDGAGRHAESVPAEHLKFAAKAGDVVVLKMGDVVRATRLMRGQTSFHTICQPLESIHVFSVQLVGEPGLLPNMPNIPVRVQSTVPSGRVPLNRA